MSKITPQAVYLAEWVPVRVQDMHGSEELFVWPGPEDDPAKRTLTCERLNGTVYAVARDGTETITQVWRIDL